MTIPATFPACAMAPAPANAPWTRIAGQWVRQTATSQARVNTDHQWSAISEVYGYARGRAADHPGAMNCVWAVLRAWNDHPGDELPDDEHHDSIWPRPSAQSVPPTTVGRAAMR